MKYYLEALNYEATHDVRGFIEKSEVRYRDQIQKTADFLVDHMREKPVLLLNGPSSSGKTTTAMMLGRALSRHGIHAEVISMDNYYRTRSDYIIPKTEDGIDDLESPECMDLPLLNGHLLQLVSGDEIAVPNFDFQTQRRTEEVKSVRLDKDTIVVIEGIHAFSDAITGGLEEKSVGLYLSVASQVELPDGTILQPEMLRFIRRAVRDSNFRAAPVGMTMQQWCTVRRGEQLYIAPYQHHASLTIDSYLPYETNILLPMLKERIRNLELQLAAIGLREVHRALDAFEEMAYQNYLPNETILHEFIG